MQVFIWHFSLILRSDCFNQSWLKMPFLLFASGAGAASLNLCQFFSLWPILLEGAVLWKLAKKAFGLTSPRPSCLFRTGWD